MRGTESHTVVLDNVFVPEYEITMQRPCGEYHSVWDVILTVALPSICAVYDGMAEAARRNGSGNRGAQGRRRVPQ